MKRPMGGPTLIKKRSAAALVDNSNDMVGRENIAIFL